jgi:nucleotide-binding universal stress UspA family protein
MAGIGIAVGFLSVRVLLKQTREENVVSWLPKKSVVVPYDFSEYSAQALETARELAHDTSRLHVIHVLPMISATDPGMIWEPVDNEAQKRNVEKAFRDAFASSPLGKVDFHVYFGDPGFEIASFAEKLSADLIVMPSHGRRGITRLLLGSVAERVLRLAQCPVLVIKSHHGSAKARPSK